jgi:integrase/recombinase XerD
LAADARARRGRVRADILNAAPPRAFGEADTKLLDAFCDALWLEDGLSRNTIVSYRTDLEQLCVFLKDRDLAGAGEEDLFAFLASRRGRASSAARMVSTLKRFYQYCLRERRVRADPTLKLDPPRRVPRFPKSLSETDVESLLAAPEIATPLGLRERAMLQLH